MQRPNLTNASSSSLSITTSTHWLRGVPDTYTYIEAIIKQYRYINTNISTVALASTSSQPLNARPSIVYGWCDDRPTTTRHTNPVAVHGEEGKLSWVVGGQQYSSAVVEAAVVVVGQQKSIFWYLEKCGVIYTLISKFPISSCPYPAHQYFGGIDAPPTTTNTLIDRSVGLFTWIAHTIYEKLTCARSLFTQVWAVCPARPFTRPELVKTS